MTAEQIILCAREVLEEEGAALLNLAKKIDASFVDAAELLIACKGRVVVTGVGKSGHVGRKFASTLASTGTPSFFVDPNESLHGDFGMITKDDVMIIISKGGEARELGEFIPFLKRMQVPYIGICANPNSTLAKNAKVALLIHVDKEACQLNLAPTTSSTVTLALTDALAVTLMRMRGFTAKEFAHFHPGGSLGKQLAEISRIMHTGSELPLVPPELPVKDALMTILSGINLGVAIVVNSDKTLAGILTDGDLKRLLTKDGAKTLDMPVGDVMTKTPKTISPNASVGEALARMEGTITALVVVDETNVPIGIVHIHDILKFKAI